MICESGQEGMKILFILHTIFQNPIWYMNYKSSCSTLWHVSTLRRVEHRGQSNVRNETLKMQLNCKSCIFLQFQNKTSKCITTLKFKT